MPNNFLEKAQLLKPVGTVVIPATTQLFVAENKFKVASSPVSIVWVGDLFREWFFRKIEEPAEETALCFAELMQQSFGAPILAALGDKAETKLSQIYWLMCQELNHDQGVLPANVWSNIFFSRDAKGVFRMVAVSRRGANWDVEADLVESPYKWFKGLLVFSQKC